MINKLSKTWYVIYTAPRSEKKVNQSLNELGFETFCPTRKVLRQWSDRKKKVDVVLFTSYVFVKTHSSEFNTIYGILGFVRFVNYLRKPAVVRDFEIENIRAFLEQTVNSTIKFEKNSQVLIISGPLKGHSGKIEMIGRNTIKIRIESLGLSMMAQVHKNKVENITA